MAHLGLNRDAVEVTTVREGRSGIFGLGAEDAIVRITALKPEEQPEAVNSEEVAQSILEKLLEYFEIDGKVNARTMPAVEGQEEATISLDIQGEDLGILIGRRGQTLSALQYIVRLIVSRKIDNWVPIVIDVEGYKQRRARALQSFAIDMADRVKARRAPFTLEPMPPHERRIIHIALANNNHVTTESIGQGDERKVVIRPKR